MSFDEHPTPEGEPEHTPEGTGRRPKPTPHTVALEDIAKMSVRDLADIAGSLEPEWCGFWNGYGFGDRSLRD